MGLVACTGTLGHEADIVGDIVERRQLNVSLAVAMAFLFGGTVQGYKDDTAGGGSSRGGEIHTIVLELD